MRSKGSSDKNSGVNGQIDLTNLAQFELNSKIGNSMKEAKMRILRHMEEINGRRFARGQNSTDTESAIEQLIQQKNKENANDPAKRGLNSDFGMVEAGRRASSMIKTR